MSAASDGSDGVATRPLNTPADTLFVMLSAAPQGSAMVGARRVGHDIQRIVVPVVASSPSLVPTIRDAVHQDGAVRRARRGGGEADLEYYAISTAPRDVVHGVVDYPTGELVHDQSPPPLNPRGVAEQAQRRRAHQPTTGTQPRAPQKPAPATSKKPVAPKRARIWNNNYPGTAASSNPMNSTGNTPIVLPASGSAQAVSRDPLSSHDQPTIVPATVAVPPITAGLIRDIGENSCYRHVIFQVINAMGPLIEFILTIRAPTSPVIRLLQSVCERLHGHGEPFHIRRTFPRLAEEFFAQLPLNQFNDDHVQNVAGAFFSAVMVAVRESLQTMPQATNIRFTLPYGLSAPSNQLLGAVIVGWRTCTSCTCANCVAGHRHGVQERTPHSTEELCLPTEVAHLAPADVGTLAVVSAQEAIARVVGKHPQQLEVRCSHCTPNMPSEAMLRTLKEHVRFWSTVHTVTETVTECGLFVFVTLATAHDRQRFLVIDDIEILDAVNHNVLTPLAVVMHAGEEGGGHYFGFVRDLARLSEDAVRNRQVPWFKVDDRHVGWLSEQDLYINGLAPRAQYGARISSDRLYARCSNVLYVITRRTPRSVPPSPRTIAAAASAIAYSPLRARDPLEPRGGGGPDAHAAYFPPDIAARNPDILTSADPRLQALQTLDIKIIVVSAVTGREVCHVDFRGYTSGPVITIVCLRGMLYLVVNDPAEAELHEELLDTYWGLWRARALDHVCRTAIEIKALRTCDRAEGQRLLSQFLERQGRELFDLSTDAGIYNITSVVLYCRIRFFFWIGSTLHPLGFKVFQRGRRHFNKNPPQDTNFVVDGSRQHQWSGHRAFVKQYWEGMNVRGAWEKRVMGNHGLELRTASDEILDLTEEPPTMVPNPPQYKYMLSSAVKVAMSQSRKSTAIILSVWARCPSAGFGHTDQDGMLMPICSGTGYEGFYGDDTECVCGTEAAWDVCHLTRSPLQRDPWDICDPQYRAFCEDFVAAVAGDGERESAAVARLRSRNVCPYQEKVVITSDHPNLCIVYKARDNDLYHPILVVTLGGGVGRTLRQVARQLVSQDPEINARQIQAVQRALLPGTSLDYSKKQMHNVLTNQRSHVQDLRRRAALGDTSELPPPLQQPASPDTKSENTSGDPHKKIQVFYGKTPGLPRCEMADAAVEGLEMVKKGQCIYIHMDPHDVSFVFTTEHLIRALSVLMGVDATRQIFRFDAHLGLLTATLPSGRTLTVALFIGGAESARCIGRVIEVVLAFRYRSPACKCPARPGAFRDLSGIWVVRECSCVPPERPLAGSAVAQVEHLVMCDDAAGILAYLRSDPKLFRLACVWHSKNRLRGWTTGPAYATIGAVVNFLFNMVFVNTSLETVVAAWHRVKRDLRLILVEFLTPAACEAFIKHVEHRHLKDLKWLEHAQAHVFLAEMSIRLASLMYTDNPTEGSIGAFKAGPMNHQMHARLPAVLNKIADELRDQEKKLSDDTRTFATSHVGPSGRERAVIRTGQACTDHVLGPHPDGPPNIFYVWRGQDSPAALSCGSAEPGVPGRELDAAPGDLSRCVCVGGVGPGPVVVPRTRLDFATFDREAADNKHWIDMFWSTLALPPGVVRSVPAARQGVDHQVVLDEQVVCAYTALLHNNTLGDQRTVLVRKVLKTAQLLRARRHPEYDTVDILRKTCTCCHSIILRQPCPGLYAVAVVVAAREGRMLDADNERVHVTLWLEMRRILGDKLERLDPFPTALEHRVGAPHRPARQLPALPGRADLRPISADELQGLVAYHVFKFLAPVVTQAELDAAVTVAEQGGRRPNMVPVSDRNRNATPADRGVSVHRCLICEELPRGAPSEHDDDDCQCRAEANRSLQRPSQRVTTASMNFTSNALSAQQHEMLVPTRAAEAARAVACSACDLTCDNWLALMWHRALSCAGYLPIMPCEPRMYFCKCCLKYAITTSGRLARHGQACWSPQLPGFLRGAVSASSQTLTLRGRVNRTGPEQIEAVLNELETEYPNGEIISNTSCTVLRIRELQSLIQGNYVPGDVAGRVSDIIGRHLIDVNGHERRVVLPAYLLESDLSVHERGSSAQFKEAAGAFFNADWIYVLTLVRETQAGYYLAVMVDRRAGALHVFDAGQGNRADNIAQAERVRAAIAALPEALLTEEQHTEVSEFVPGWVIHFDTGAPTLASDTYDCVAVAAWYVLHHGCDGLVLPEGEIGAARLRSIRCVMSSNLLANAIVASATADTAESAFATAEKAESPKDLDAGDPATPPAGSRSPSLPPWIPPRALSTFSAVELTRLAQIRQATGPDLVRGSEDASRPFGGAVFVIRLADNIMVTRVQDSIRALGGTVLPDPAYVAGVTHVVTWQKYKAQGESDQETQYRRPFGHVYVTPWFIEVAHELQYYPPLFECLHAQRDADLAAGESAMENRAGITIGLATHVTKEAPVWADAVLAILRALGIYKASEPTYLISDRIPLVPSNVEEDGPAAVYVRIELLTEMARTGRTLLLAADSVYRLANPAPEDFPSYRLHEHEADMWAGHRLGYLMVGTAGYPWGVKEGPREWDYDFVEVEDGHAYLVLTSPNPQWRKLRDHFSDILYYSVGPENLVIDIYGAQQRVVPSMFNPQYSDNKRQLKLLREETQRTGGRIPCGARLHEIFFKQFEGWARYLSTQAARSPRAAPSPRAISPLPATAHAEDLASVVDVTDATSQPWGKTRRDPTAEAEFNRKLRTFALPSFDITVDLVRPQGDRFDVGLQYARGAAAVLCRRHRLLDPTADPDVAYDQGVGRAVVRRRDLLCLRPNEKVNDLVMDSFLYLLQEENNARCAAQTMHGVVGGRLRLAVCLSAMVYSEADSTDLDSSWLKPNTISDCALVIVPVCEEEHWFFITADPQARQFGVYDNYYDRPHTRAVCIVRMVYERFTGVMTATWTIARVANLPQQHDASSCGVMVMLGVESIAVGDAIFSYTAASVAPDRLRVAAAIASRKINAERWRMNDDHSDHGDGGSEPSSDNDGDQNGADQGGNDAPAAPAPPAQGSKRQREPSPRQDGDSTVETAGKRSTMRVIIGVKRRLDETLDDLDGPPSSEVATPPPSKRPRAEAPIAAATAIVVAEQPEQPKQLEQPSDTMELRRRRVARTVRNATAGPTRERRPTRQTTPAPQLALDNALTTVANDGGMVRLVETAALAPIGIVPSETAGSEIAAVSERALAYYAAEQADETWGTASSSDADGPRRAPEHPLAPAVRGSLFDHGVGDEKKSRDRRQSKRREGAPIVDAKQRRAATRGVAFNSHTCEVCLDVSSATYDQHQAARMEIYRRRVTDRRVAREATPADQWPQQRDARDRAQDSVPNGAGGGLADAADPEYVALEHRQQQARANAELTRHAPALLQRLTPHDPEFQFGVVQESAPANRRRRARGAARGT